MNPFDRDAHPVRDFLIKLGLLAFWAWLVYRLNGWMGLLVVGVIGPAVILPRYLFAAVSAFVRWVDWRVWRHKEGQRISYFGYTLRSRVVENVTWLCTDDLAAALQKKPWPMHYLCGKVAPTDIWTPTPGRLVYLNEAGTAAWLACQATPDAAKLALWLERNVYFAAPRPRRESADAS